MQLRVLGRIVADAKRRARGIGITALETGAVALRPEPGKPDAGLLAGAAAHQADGRCGERDAKDRADPLEVVVDAVPPVIVDRFAEPGAGLVLGRVGQFGEVVDGGFDDTHGSGSFGMGLKKTKARRGAGLS